MKTPANKVKKVHIGAKVPPDIKEKIDRMAATEIRSASQIIARLLETHPMLKKKRGQSTTAIA